MSELGVVELSDGGQIVIEVSDISDEEKQRIKPHDSSEDNERLPDLPRGAQPTGVKEDLTDALAQMRGNIQTLATEVHEALKDHSPKKWSLEFSIGFKGKVNPIPFIASGEANSALKVTATWEKE